MNVDIAFMNSNINIVKSGYAGGAADKYRKDKDNEQLEIGTLKYFLKDEKNNNVLELGCASGYPVGKSIIDAGKAYTGIDLFIGKAHEEYPELKHLFLEGEMLEFLRSQKSGSRTGILSMFCVFHLPREHHVQLFTEIYRVLSPGGLFLMDLPPSSIEKYELEDWLGSGKSMYWSCFSAEWTSLTLNEIGFRVLDQSEYVKEFDGEMEKTEFVLFRKPSP